MFTNVKTTTHKLVFSYNLIGLKCDKYIILLFLRCFYPLVTDMLSLMDNYHEYVHNYINIFLFLYTLNFLHVIVSGTGAGGH